MTTKLQLYQGAHMILRQNAVDMAITDDTAFVNNLDLVFDKTARWCLEQGLWNYATRTVALEASVSVVPQFGYNFAIEKPDDYAGRIVAISANQRFWPNLNDYQEEGGLSGFIFCNHDPLYLRYISNGVQYGLNLANWPETFATFVEHELAWRVAPHVTSMSAAEKEELRKDKTRAMRDARSKDALNQGSERPPPGRLVRSRHGRTGMRNSWRC